MESAPCHLVFPPPAITVPTWGSVGNYVALLPFATCEYISRALMLQTDFAAWCEWCLLCPLILSTTCLDPDKLQGNPSSRHALREWIKNEVKGKDQVESQLGQGRGEQRRHAGLTRLWLDQERTRSGRLSGSKTRAALGIGDLGVRFSDWSWALCPLRSSRLR